MSSSTPQTPKRLPLLGLVPAALLLSSCGLDSDPLEEEEGTEAAPAASIAIGSQAYYSNEIIAEIYAQALEDAGFEVEREFQIGQREVYMPELEDGEIDLLPDYTGNLAQFYDEDVESGSEDETHQYVQDVLPEGLQALDWAEATDQDSYTVTAETADANELTTIGDLTSLDQPVSMAANSEFEARPYGPDGAETVYGVDVEVTAVEDSGGPLTVGALLDGDVEVANIYTSSPAIVQEDLVPLEDPEHLILPQNVVPIATDELDEDAVEVINEVQAQLNLDDLIELNIQSVEEEVSSDVVAEDWLADQQ